jgi:Ca2+-binding EF-hand superfamily protein
MCYSTATSTTSSTAAIAPIAKKEPVAPISGKVGIVVAGNIETDFVVTTITKALVLAGVSGTMVAKVADVATLAYAAKNLSRNVDVLIAATIIANDVNGTVTQSLTNILLQEGIMGRVPIIPAVVAQPSLLEAKALLPAMAEGWAQSAAAILAMNFGDSIEMESAPEIVIPVAPVYTATEDNLTVLLDVLRDSLKSHGARGIAGLSRKFRIADDNGNGQVDLKEFTKVITEHGFNWTSAQIKKVFDHFDSDKSGDISFDEFIFAIRGELNERRKNLVLLAFDVLDADHSGVVEINDLRGKYDASKHPDVKSGKRSTDEVLR